MALPERLDYSYEQLAAERGVPMSFLQALHQSLGFAPPARQRAQPTAPEEPRLKLHPCQTFSSERVGTAALIPGPLAPIPGGADRTARVRSSSFTTTSQSRRDGQATR